MAAVQDVEAAVGEYQRTGQQPSSRGQQRRGADFRFEAGDSVAHGGLTGKACTILERVGDSSEFFRLLQHGFPAWCL